ncbi:MAG: TrkH family potassium uptake protein [Bacteroidales bacterium]|nr:TrkH family potassium uptake protein [Bacteroidales bacterium]
MVSLTGQSITYPKLTEVKKYGQRSYINIKMLLRVIGWLLMIESAFMAVPMIVGFFMKDCNWVEFLISIAITAGCGSVMMSLKPHSREMGKREAIMLTGLTWVILSLFGMLPFMLCSTRLSITDAFFETMSGYTTTGASVLNTLADVPQSILLWRCIVQWIGGLGIILFTLAVVPMLNYQGGMQLFNAEVTGITHDKLRPRVSFTAQSLWLVYIILTGILIGLLSLADINIFDAVCYGLSTMSTGGFSTSDTSVTEMENMYLKIVIAVFMFLGGVNFALIYKAACGQIKAVFRNDTLKVYLAIILVCYLIFVTNSFFHGTILNIADWTIDPLFQTISILSSTGLTEPDFHEWGPIATVLLIVMMVMGSCAGSTSGGVKIDRFIVLFKFLKNQFFQLMHPNAVTTVVINGKGTSYVTVQKTLAFLFIYIIVIMSGGVGLVLLGLPLKDSFFCALSAISNTGLGTDITGIQGNYAYVPDAAKWILSFIMLTGRLELFTILVLFTPAFWRN